MKTVTLICIMATILVSCKDTAVTNAIVDNAGYISVRNSRGEDLLNPETNGYYKAENIKLFYEKNGSKSEVNNGNLDNPRSFKIDKFAPNGEYYIRLFANTGSVNDNIAITYIQWDSNDEDTLQAEYIKNDNSIIVTKILWNGKKVFDTTDKNREENWGTKAFDKFWEIKK